MLGLTWQDVDFGPSVIRVRWQLSRASSKEPARRIPLKTKAGQRDIYLLPELASLLREHRRIALQRGFARPEDFVFGTGKGTSLCYRNVCVRGLDKAADAAKLNVGETPKLSMHDLRHTYASHLIRQGVDPVRAARQLGHARPSITLDVYAHDFEAARQTDDLGERLSAAFDGVL